MTEWRLFPEGTVPEFTTAEWYAGRERAPHLEQAAHRDRLFLATEFVRMLAAANGCRTLSDFGCGDGGLMSLVDCTAGLTRCWGYDLCHAAVEGACERGMTAGVLDVVTGNPEYGDITVVTEILEHLTDPHAFVTRMARETRYLVASSPANESLWSHYEFHAWAWDMAGYRNLLEQGGWRVIRHEQVAGFQVIAAERA